MVGKGKRGIAVWAGAAGDAINGLGNAANQEPSESPLASRTPAWRSLDPPGHGATWDEAPPACRVFGASPCRAGYERQGLQGFCRPIGPVVRNWKPGKTGRQRARREADLPSTTTSPPPPPTPLHSTLLSRPPTAPPHLIRAQKKCCRRRDWIPAVPSCQPAGQRTTPRIDTRDAFQVPALSFSPLSLFPFRLFLAFPPSRDPHRLPSATRPPSPLCLLRRLKVSSLCPP